MWGSPPIGGSSVVVTVSKDEVMTCLKLIVQTAVARAAIPVREKALKAARRFGNELGDDIGYQDIV
jgi:hypothetical protein